MGDSAFSLPTLLVIAPAAGGLVAMSMLTRRAAALTSLVTFLVQAVLLAFPGAVLDGVREVAPPPVEADPAADEAAEGYATDDVDPLDELD